MEAEIAKGKMPDEEWKILRGETAIDLQDEPLVLHFRCKYKFRDQLPNNMGLNEAQRNRVKKEVDRIDSLRSNFETRNGELIKKLSKSRKEWTHEAKDKCADRIKKLESFLKETRAEQSTASSEEEELLAKEESRWESELKTLRAFHDWSPAPHSQAPANDTDDESYDKSYGIVVKSIYLKSSSSDKGSGKSNYRYDKDYNEVKRHNYPALSLHDFLYSDDKKRNPLVSKCDEDTIQYFHIPANNMVWVEEALARYYKEKRGEYNYRRATNYCARSSNLLCRKYWTGQEHGIVTDPIHARHMRHHCAHITSEELGENENKANSTTNGAVTSETRATRNFVIFMPYLHWETSRRCGTMTKVIKDVTNQNKLELRKKFEVGPGLHFADTVAAFRAQYASSRTQYDTDLKRDADGKYSNADTRFSSKFRPSRTQSSLVSTDERQQGSRRTKLGEYLMNVAEVYEAMDIDADVNVLRDFLHHTPPLHARRTLDQSYYSKLPDTKSRDEDQVVYRATKAAPGESTGKTARVTMVDQLWLYVLDDKTIISFFPRRWGRNKPDFSGVHKAIQSRLEHLRHGEIQSVHDLALIIMNECSTVFFDRTKPADARPQVLDIFANSIAQVSEKKSIAFERLWAHLTKLNPEGGKGFMRMSPEVARVYLNVNPEGKLLREAHDIKDELQMMEQIYQQQLQVAIQFSKALLYLSGESVPAATRERSKIAHTTAGRFTTETTDRISGDANSLLIGSVPCLDETIFTPLPPGTLERATNLIEDVNSRLVELKYLKETTNEITDHLKDLLNLKQQQAGIIEAEAALDMARESVNQGRAIMMFTVVTIVFLPLSFMSSVFGMNAKELSGADGGIMSIKRQFRFMFSISFGIIVISLTLAFGNWIRAALLFAAHIIWVAFEEYTGLLWLWQRCTRGYNNVERLDKKQRGLEILMYGRKRREAMKKFKKEAKVIEEKIAARSDVRERTEGRVGRDERELIRQKREQDRKNRLKREEERKIRERKEQEKRERQEQREGQGSWVFKLRQRGAQQVDSKWCGIV